jgi:uncharacterized alpha/beta hydrolase family protein
MVNSQFSASVLGSCCDKITQIGGGVISYQQVSKANLNTNGNLALDSIQPTLIITGSGGADTAANTITFNFSKIIRDGSFTGQCFG